MLITKTTFPIFSKITKTSCCKQYEDIREQMNK